MTGEVIGIGVAAVAAVASWISAYTNRQTADRALRAFVWPVISSRLDEAGRNILLVRLKNDGAGTAFNVRWSVGSVTANERGKIVSDQRLTAEHVSLVVRAMRPG